jgi:hypothetical protein
MQYLFVLFPPAPLLMNIYVYIYIYWVSTAEMSFHIRGCFRGNAKRQCSFKSSNYSNLPPYCHTILRPRYCGNHPTPGKNECIHKCRSVSLFTIFYSSIPLVEMGKTNQKTRRVGRRSTCSPRLFIPTNPPEPPTKHKVVSIETVSTFLPRHGHR